MRRRRPRREDRVSPFGLWLEAINCGDPDWLDHAGDVRWSGDVESVVARWLSWPGHSAHVLWWAR